MKKKSNKKSKTKGLKPKNRKLATTTKNTKKKKLTANQWQNTPQQTKFMEHWLDPRSETFGNAHKSALLAGYNERYAAQIASPAVNNLWIQAYTKKLNLTEEHIKQGIQNLAVQAENSRSPDDTRLKAYEVLARIQGILDNKNQTNVTLVQPILSGQSLGDNKHKKKVQAEVYK